MYLILCEDNQSLAKQTLYTNEIIIMLSNQLYAHVPINQKKKKKLYAYVASPILHHEHDVYDHLLSSSTTLVPKTYHFVCSFS